MCDAVQAVLLEGVLDHFNDMYVGIHHGPLLLCSVAQL